MPRHRKTLVALTAGAIALGAADAAPAKNVPTQGQSRPASPCKPPDAGFQACLRVLYKPADDGGVEDVRVVATLVRGVATCPSRTAKRRVVIRTRADGTRLDSTRRPGTCRKGVVTWRASFSPAQTAGWQLQQGDTVDSSWSGVRNAASVEISGGA